MSDHLNQRIASLRELIRAGFHQENLDELVTANPGNAGPESRLPVTRISQLNGLARTDVVDTVPPLQAIHLKLHFFGGLFPEE